VPWTQGLTRWQQGVLAGCVRGWRQQAQLQLYRRRVIAVVGTQVSNGVLLRAFNCWR
jgi:hypothetical protein